MSARYWLRFAPYWARRVWPGPALALFGSLLAGFVGPAAPLGLVLSLVALPLSLVLGYRAGASWARRERVR